MIRQLGVVACMLIVLSALSVRAQTVKLTIYDDGLSCPANCDAHVVFHPSLNGTEFAHAPATAKPPHSKCVVGEPCRLCLESGLKQCLVATYRGGGPPPMTFDLTPRFYETVCAAEPEQAHLAAKCKELRKAAAGLANRVNCIASPNHERCAAMIAAAKAARERDRVQYDLCKASGEA